MGVQPESEFNSVATPSAALLRRLVTLAAYGNDSLFTVFTAMAESSGLTERGRESREKLLERYTMLMLRANEARIAEFRRTLDRMERESYEALTEAEERLHKARQEEKRAMDGAHKVRMPDGSVMRVYRDGDIVRDDDGNVVGDDIIKADEIPESCTKWPERAGRRVAVQKAEQDHTQIVEFRARVDAVQDAASDGDLSPEDAEGLAASLREDVPAALRERLAAGAGPGDEAAASQFTRHQDASTPGPM